jgi:hypothetical protein
MADLSSY